MSWDMFLQGLPKEVRAIEEIPGHFPPQPTLPRQRRVEVFKEVAPFTDFSNPRWWRIACDFF